MGFNTKQFMSQKFEPRTQVVPVPGLAPFFSENEKPEFTVRNIEGPELAEVHNAVSINKGIDQILEKIVSEKLSDKINAIRESIGMGDKVPGEIVRRLEMLVRGSVKPVITLDIAVKICKTYPIEFYELTNKITQLTGLGKVLGKPKPSGKRRK